MPHTATIVPLTRVSQTLASAVVTRPGDKDGFVRVHRKDDPLECQARIAVYPRPELGPGDEVLTMTDDSGQSYVVGILSCINERSNPVSQVRLADGAFAQIDRSSANESLKLYSKKNELLVDYHSQTGTVRVNVESGNLEFATTNGSIAFHSAKDIVIDGNHVAMNARNDIHLGVQDPTGGAGPVMSMNSKKMHLVSPVMEITAQRAQLFLQETQIAGKKLLGRIGNVQFIARKLESVADTVMSRAKNVYRRVTELSQLKAGRQRTIIEKTCHMKAQKTIFKSDNDFKVKAKKIHLG